MQLRVRRMQVSVQGVAILSLIFNNVEGRGLGIHRVTRSSYIHGHPHMRSLFICIHSRKRKKDKLMGTAIRIFFVLAGQYYFLFLNYLDR